MALDSTIIRNGIEYVLIGNPLPRDLKEPGPRDFFVHANKHDDGTTESGWYYSKQYLQSVGIV